MNHTVIDPETTDGNSTVSGRWMVQIFNDESHSMDEVVTILMAATLCDHQEAAMEMWEAHTFGKAAVHFASRGTCDEISAKIAASGLTTEVVPEWVE